jgi:hypothetical protein
MSFAPLLGQNDRHVAQSKRILHEIEKSDLTGDSAQQFRQEERE